MNFCAQVSKRNALIGTTNNKTVEIPFKKNITDECIQTKSDANSQIFEAKAKNKNIRK